MQSDGASEPKKGSGYFAKRLKEKGLAAEPEKPQGGESKEPDAAVQKAGQIFEESTKSIATMADDVSETAKLVSSMKEGLERVTKIADLFSNNPLCDSSGSCSFEGVSFTQDNDAEGKVGEDGWPVIETQEMPEELSEASEAASRQVSDLQIDADVIKEGLAEFQNAISRKESELLEFREKLKQARQQTVELVPQMISGTLANTVGELQAPDNISEFDTATSSQNASFETAIGVPDGIDMQQQISEDEKKLVELRWKIKKAEVEYEKRRAAAEETEDLTGQVEKLESRRDQLQSEIKSLEAQHKEPMNILRELERKIEAAKKELEEKTAASQQLGDVRSVLEYLKMDKDALKAELDQIRARTKEAENEYEERRAAADALEDVRFTVSAMRAEKETLEAELDQLRSRTKKAEQEYEERRLEREKIGELKSVLTHLRLEKEALDAEMSDLRLKIKKAESEYRQKKDAAEEIQEVREVLAYLKPEREYLRMELSQIRSKVESMERQYDDLVSKKRQMHLECDELGFKIKRLEVEHGEKKSFSRLS